MKARKTIFDRSAQRPSLTEEGPRLFDCASAMEQEAAGFLEGISSGTAAITVGFTGAAENPELLAFAQGFRRRHPDISLKFRKGTFKEGRRQLLGSETDCCFGLAETFGAHDPIRAERLFRYEFCIICSFDSPLVQKDCLTPEDLAHGRFLALDESYGQGFIACFSNTLLQTTSSQQASNMCSPSSS